MLVEKYEGLKPRGSSGYPAKTAKTVSGGLLPKTVRTPELSSEGGKKKKASEIETDQSLTLTVLDL